MHRVDLDSIGFVKIPVFLGCGEGQVWQVEAHTHKPWWIASSAFAHNLDTVAGGMVVFINFVRHFGAFGGRFRVVFAPWQCAAFFTHFLGWIAPRRSILADPTIAIVHASAIVDLTSDSGSVAVGS